MTYRDFKGSGEAGGHPDFELSATRVHDASPYYGINEVGCGLVEATLGADGKPLFYSGSIDKADPLVVVAAGSGRQMRVVSGPGCWTEENSNPDLTQPCFVGSCQPWTTSGPGQGTFGEIASATTFDSWYNDTASVNVRIAGEIPLAETSPGVFAFHSDAFFPIDDQGFGNTPGHAHNFHFTTEIHVSFTYQPGQLFTFRGDDDLWIFVNGSLALDVGGLHQALTGTLDFDAQAASLGLVPGNTYLLSIFHAERQTDVSNFSIETNIPCFAALTVQ